MSNAIDSIIDCPILSHTTPSVIGGGQGGPVTYIPSALRAFRPGLYLIQVCSAGCLLIVHSDFWFRNTQTPLDGFLPSD